MSSTLPLYIVDAFAQKPFEGNPAAVCLVEDALSDEKMQQIASEMNLSETAYIQRLQCTDNFSTSSRFKLRWFTPTNEVPLCGHATVASAATLFFVKNNQSDSITFDTASGPLITYRHGNSGITMNFPLNKPVPHEMDSLKPLLQLIVQEDFIHSVHYSEKTKKLLVRLNDSFTREQLEDLKPKLSQFQTVENSGRIKGVIVTTAGNTGSDEDSSKKSRSYDFLSRYFAPWNGIPEDPVTARQCSARGGDVLVEIRDDGRVNLRGEAAIVLRGQLSV